MSRTVLLGPRFAQSRETLRDPLHSTLCFYTGSPLSIVQSELLLHVRCYFCPVCRPCRRSSRKRWATFPLPLLTCSVWPGFGQDLAHCRCAEAFWGNTKFKSQPWCSHWCGRKTCTVWAKGETSIGQNFPPREERGGEGNAARNSSRCIQH